VYNANNANNLWAMKRCMLLHYSININVIDLCKKHIPQITKDKIYKYYWHLASFQLTRKNDAVYYNDSRDELEYVINYLFTLEFTPSLQETRNICHIGNK
jgi:hypothetical protein